MILRRQNSCYISKTRFGLFVVSCCLCSYFFILLNCKWIKNFFKKKFVLIIYSFIFFKSVVNPYHSRHKIYICKYVYAVNQGRDWWCHQSTPFCRLFSVDVPTSYHIMGFIKWKVWFSQSEIKFASGIEKMGIFRILSGKNRVL